MRICIFGTGAIGGHLAAKLASAGHDVAAIARGPNLAALRARGIALRHGERTFSRRVRASERAAVQNGIPWWYAQGLAPSRPKPPADMQRLDP
ncbi:MAG: ketopantoate reductase family protein, partial [Burkholderiales bacterium]